MITRMLLAALLLGSVATSLSAQELVGFRRGDCNGDGSFNLSDPSFLLVALFENPTLLSCEDACDADDDGVLSVADVILALSVIFGGTATLPPPVEHCDGDPTGDPLTCQVAGCSHGTVIADWVFTLPSARVGAAYEGALPEKYREQITWDTGPETVITQQGIAFQRYGVEATSDIPPGLALDPLTGVLGGVASEIGLATVTFWAESNLGQRVRIRADLTCFPDADLTTAPPQNYYTTGPFPVNELQTTFQFTHELPWPLPLPLWGCNPTPPPQLIWILDKDVKIFYPVPLDQARPLLVFHHGSGYDGDDYDDVLGHLASHGFIVASVTDQFPFFTVSAFYCWGGHEEAARVMLATREFVEGLAADAGSVLYQGIDPDRVFYGGHSRGASSAIIASEWDHRTRGVVALQPTDAKGDSFIGNTSRWETLPRVPMLLMSAEQDTDVLFPFAERLLERLRGPSTMVTIFGGCHGYTSDFQNSGCNTCTWTPNPPFLDVCRYISRPAQHQLTKLYSTAFLARHGMGDVDAERLLYGDQNQTSARVGVAYRRPMGSTRLIDDFTQFPLNALGLPVTATGVVSMAVGSCYDTPDPAPAPLTPIHNLVLELPFQGSAKIHMPLGTGSSPFDASGHRRLLFRIKNSDRHWLVDNFGFDWLTLSLRLEDAAGNEATLDLSTCLPSTVLCPQPEPPTATVIMKYQRYFTVSVPLDDFLVANPALDLGQLISLDWLWDTDGSEETAPFIGLDDVVME